MVLATGARVTSFAAERIELSPVESWLRHPLYHRGVPEGWRTYETLGGNLRKRATSDAAPHVFVVWPRTPALIRSQLIGYVWDPALSAGTVQKSRKTGTVTFLIVRSGTSQLGQWLTERRNVAEDFRLVYGVDADPPRAVALSIDTNDTQAASEGFIGAILFRGSN